VNAARTSDLLWQAYCKSRPTAGWTISTTAKTVYVQPLPEETASCISAAKAIRRHIGIINGNSVFLNELLN
jgi:hypothetical protein